MRLQSFEIRNYKSFGKTGKLAVAPARTLVVGGNNSGKSALLEGMSLKFSRHPHRTPKRKAGFPSPEVSEVEFDFVISGEELKRFLLGINREFRVPFPFQLKPVSEKAVPWFQELLSRNELVFTSTKVDNSIRAHRYPPFDVELGAGGNPLNVVFKVDVDRSGFVFCGHQEQRSDELGALVGQHFVDSTYWFAAERLRLAECTAGVSGVLKADATNLAEALDNLQSKNVRFAEFIKLVRRVLPVVKDISIQRQTENRVKIFVSNYEYTNREDLFVGLENSGSGVGQVLAILYVLLTSSDPRTIIIDEPNSFLHPGAVRRLLEVMKEHDRHQFIISTHSPDVISNAEAQALFMTRWVDSSTQIETLDAAHLQSVRTALSEVGARLSDVFGADQVLWVEGRTEELCIPPIITSLLARSLVGTAVVGVAATGDFRRKRDRRLVLEIYKKLTNSSVLIPTALGLMFDRDRLADAEVKAANEDSGGLVHFIPRTCFENYLVKPEAIAHVINGEQSDKPTVTADAVAAWLSQHGSEEVFFAPWPVRTYGTPDWNKEVAAAELLDRLFWDMRIVSYDKVKHSYQLTMYMLQHSPSEFDDLVDLLRKVLR